MRIGIEAFIRICTKISQEINIRKSVLTCMGTGLFISVAIRIGVGARIERTMFVRFGQRIGIRMRRWNKYREGFNDMYIAWYTDVCRGR